MKIEEDNKLKEKQLEIAKFKNELLKEAAEKAYLADKINKILEEESFEEQKSLYKSMKKFFDNPEEEQAYKLRKEAGKSAFDGVVKSNGNTSNNIFDFGNAYINKILGKK